MTYVTLHPQYDSYPEMSSVLEMATLTRPDPGESPFPLPVVHDREIFAFQMRLCHLDWAPEISLKATAEQLSGNQH